MSGVGKNLGTLKFTEDLEKVKKMSANQGLEGRTK